MIRLAKREELNEILEVYAAARSFMRENGNPTQWKGGYPGPEVLLEDMEQGNLYVVEENGICGCFALIDGGEPTYEVIQGSWLDDTPYGTIHRVASNGKSKALVAKCMAFARQRFDHLRIDTHADNIPMQRALEKEGFSCCGIIHLENGDPRMGYEWMAQDWDGFLRGILPEGEPEVTQFRGEEGNAYDVWEIRAGQSGYVLKKAKGCELEVYEHFLTNTEAVPKVFGKYRWRGEDYFLMERVEGADLCRCHRRKLTLALDALMELQRQHWESPETAGFSFEASLPGRENRGKYLNDPVLEKAYGRYLELYRSVPRTLCHDDLLPFNVLVGEERAVIIDWEVGGILPWPNSLARLIAHGDESGGDIFYMTEADREFAVGYYFDNLIREKGISYGEYRETLDYFLFYEYCEWIMLGNRYPESADMTRFKRYLAKAGDHMRKLK